MTSKEYMGKIKKAEEKWLDDKVIRNLSSDNPNWDIEGMEYRKIKALEIIAEELIKLNENSEYVITTLENIETTMKAR